MKTLFLGLNTLLLLGLSGISVAQNESLLNGQQATISSPPYVKLVDDNNSATTNGQNQSTNGNDNQNSDSNQNQGNDQSSQDQNQQGDDDGYDDDSNQQNGDTDND